MYWWVATISHGNIDADLGGGLIKQRVARQGKGRSGGYRMIVAYRIKTRALFLFGFAKSDRENIEQDQLASARVIAEDLLALDDESLKRAILERFHHWCTPELRAPFLRLFPVARAGVHHRWVQHF